MTSDPAAPRADSARRQADEQPCSDARYGPHADAHEAICAYVAEVTAILGATPEDEVPEAVTAALAPVLATEDLLCASHCEGDPGWYRKHILFACPQGRFTLLALVWLPGQGTVIHGHTAWGAVGVYAGTPNVAVYDCSEERDGTHAVTEVKDVRCKPGDLATVRPGLCDVHRIYNATDAPVITLHCYGRDLVEDPDAINLDLTL